ncbi:hypothetical protein J3R30DRAFT_3464102 [Lentinula aciculospora]|uniref:Exoribonuclease phosphorolytic domain-containing protein n=1 Tax=Lentinula aciculospora TaxID=153920 RepID=A0A9W9DQG0_9AGAR|nr:hypothetical protein J3R30DRAFT_3464102 [Lentinula aciculospora]
MSLDFVLSFDSLSRVDGSARFGFGLHPQYLTSVSGPIEVRLASEQPSQATIEVHVRPLTNVPGIESKKAAVLLKEVLQMEVIMEANPRTLTQFVVQALVPTLKMTDELVAAMINCCTLSLLNAGSVPMRGVICAVSIGRLSSANGEIAIYKVQPVEEQKSGMEATGCFAFLFSDSFSSNACVSSCVWTNWRSSHTESGKAVEEDDLMRALDVARSAARRVWEQMKLLVEERERPRTKMKEILVKSATPAITEAEKMDVKEEDAKMEI